MPGKKTHFFYKKIAWRGRGRLPAEVKKNQFSRCRGCPKRTGFAPKSAEKRTRFRIIVIVIVIIS